MATITCELQPDRGHRNAARPRWWNPAYRCHHFREKMFSAKQKNLLCRNRDELFSSHRNQENRSYEGSPPQGLSEPRRGSAVFSDMLIVPDPPRGRPVGGGGNYHNRGYGSL